MKKNFSTNVTRKDIEFLKNGSVALKSHGLLNAFVHSAQHAILKLAKTVSLISMDNVSIDERGRIIIDDHMFVQTLKSKLAGIGAAGDTNYVCKNAYQCKP